MEYQAKIDKAMQKIADVVDKLEDTLGKLEEDGGKIKHFFEQQKALMEIKSIVHEAKKIEGYQDAEVKEGVTAIQKDQQREGSVLESIEKAYSSLDGALERLGETDSKIKSFIEQHRVLHLVKKILNKEGKYDNYVEDEINRYDNLTK